MIKVRSHKDLEVWQRSIAIVTELYNITKTFPREEMYGLISQMRRSAVSIPSNIAEGRERKSTKEYIRFLRIASGSIAELETQMIISNNLGFLSEEKLKGFNNELSQIGRMISGMVSTLSAKIRTP